MTFLKQAERFATGAFCPTAPVLALGTVAGAVDMNFSSTSVLELFHVEFSSDSSEMTLAGKAVTVPDRFNRLAWGAKPTESSALPYGILAGGLADGQVCLWDPSIILKASSTQNALLARLQKHTGGVKGLQFNAGCPNQLASGGADGDLHIWDVTHASQPTLACSYPKVATPGSSDSQITHLAWNPKVQNILATTSSSGVTAVWNLKQKSPKPVISFRDTNSQRRCSVLQWNPETSTQLVVASDDDRWPTLQMWDLRNSVSPLKEFVGHTKGVLGMSWCPHDLSLLLSSGKDNRTICWDSLTGDIVCELPVSDNWSFDVQWCPTIPGIFEMSSFDGKVGLTSIHACTVSGYEQTLNADWTYSAAVPSESRPLQHTPAWMKRPCGATFGFGGRLVSFVNHKHAVADPTGQQRMSISTQVTVNQVIAEQDLVGRSQDFDNIMKLASTDRSSLREYCSQKSSADGKEEEETWSFLGLLFEEDARRQLLGRLGFADVLPQPLQPEQPVDNLATATEALKLDAGATQPSPDAFFDQPTDASFFDNLPEDAAFAESPVVSPTGAAAATALSATPSVQEDLEPREHEEEIQRALFAGNYSSAVDHCIKANRMADALLIANICGSELYKQTMHRYMKASPRPYMRIINAVVDNDYLSLVKTRPVAQWRETLAVLATYTDTDQWNSLCDALASRLQSAGMNHAASLCYICAGNVEAAVTYWTKATKTGKLSVENLQSIMEKAIILGMATSSKKASAALSDLVAAYASILAANGRMFTALEYLDLVPGEASSSVAVLKDRIYRSGAPDVAGKVKPMPFPFIYQEVFSAQPQQQQQQQAKQPQQIAHAAAHSYGSSNQWGQASTHSYGAASGLAPAAAVPQSRPATHTPAAPTNYYGYSAAQPAASSTYTTPAASAGYNATPAYPQQPSSYNTPAPAPAHSNSTPYGSNYPAYTAPSNTTAYSGAGPANPYAAPPAAANPYAAPPAPATNPYAAPAAGVNPYAAPPAPEKPKQPAPVVAPPPAVDFRTSTKPVVPPPAPGPMPTGPTAPVPGYGPSHPAPMSVPPPATPTAAVPPPAVFKPTVSSHAPPAVPPAGAAPPPAAAMPPPAVPTSPPARAAPPPAVTPPANITIQTADTASVPADQKAVVAALTNLYNACLPVASQPGKKREMDDNSKRIGQLFWKMNRNDVSPPVVQKLQQLAAALEVNDLATAGRIQMDMTTTNWDECSQWLTALKRLIKTRSMLG